MILTADGLVLSGGQGRRVNQRDKGLLPYAGQPCVSYAINALRPLCGRLFVSANRHLDRYREFDVDAVLSDRRADFQGPLAGIEAAADSVSGDVLLLLPCDLPRLAATVPALLLKQLQDQPEADAVYAQTADRAHYLCAALRRRSLDSLSEQLDAGERSMRGWYQSIHAMPRYFGKAESGGFRNFNSSEDFRG